MFYQIDFGTPWEGLIGGRGIIYTTSDGGARWTVSYRGPAAIYAFDFLSGRTVWALGAKTLLQSRDGGRSWAVAAVNEPSLAQVQFINSRTGYAVRGNGGVPSLYSGAHGLLATRDGGKHWAPVTGLQAVDAVSFASPSVGWAATPTELLRTDNGGRKWTAVRHFRESSTAVAAVSADAWLLVLGPAAAGHGPYTLYRVTDSGRRMAASAANPYFYPHSPAAKGAPDANLTGWSTRGATAWLIANSPIGSEQYLWSYSGDGGRHWSFRGPIRGAYLYGSPNAVQPLAIDFARPNDGWMVQNHAGHGELWRSTDAGLTWRRTPM